MVDLKKYKVIKDRDTDYPNPIILKKGEHVEIKGEYLEKEEWQGWVRCSNRKNEGWAPKQIIKIVGNEGKVLENYSANEMRIRKGDIVYGEKELNGWIWGTNSITKEAGWVPVENVIDISS